MRANCAAPLAPSTLVAYWLGELDEQAEAPVDEHLLGCAECAAELQGLVDLAGGIRSLIACGGLRAVVASAFPARLAAAGLRVREYRVARNGSVLCTVAPDDDVVVAHLEAPLAGVERVDLVWIDTEGRGLRLEDIPFDAPSAAVVLAPGTATLRALPPTTMRLQLIAVDDGVDRLIGEYTFRHTPWQHASPA